MIGIFEVEKCFRLSCEIKKKEKKNGNFVLFIVWSNFCFWRKWESDNNNVGGKKMKMLLIC